MQRYRLIHKPKKLVSQPQITTPVVGEGRYVRMGGAEAYGHVILQLEPNPDQDGCFMLWSVTPEYTPDMNPDDLLTTQFLDDVYRGLCEAIAEDVENSAGIPYVPFPYENTNIRIIDGSEHPTDSRPIYYRRAAYLALEDAVSKVLGVRLQERFPMPTDDPPLLFEPVVENLRYHALQNSLRQKSWRYADKLTKELIFELGGGEYSSRDETYCLSGKWTENILNADLQLLDRLWTTYSRGRFGFSVHKRIFLECGGKTGDRSEREVWERFNWQVGWKLNDDDPREETISLFRYILSQNRFFHRRAPSGYLPCLQEWGDESVKEELIQLILSRDLPRWMIQPY
jgi:hypothetical protein